MTNDLPQPTDAMKACPFCGTLGELMEGHRNHWRVECPKCGVRRAQFANGGDEEDKARAIRSWNTRTPDTPSEDVVERRAEFLRSAYKRAFEEGAESTIEQWAAGEAGEPPEMPHKDCANEGAYQFVEDLLPDLAALSPPRDDGVEALRLHVVYEAMPADRGGANGPKGKAWAAFIAARDAALAKADDASLPRDDTLRQMVEALVDKAEAVESGPNGSGGMRVVVHFSTAGEERPLFDLLNALLSQHKDISNAGGAS